MLDALAKHDRVDEMVMLFNLLDTLAVPMNEQIFTTLVNAYSKRGSVAGMHEIMSERARRFDHPPPSATGPSAAVLLLLPCLLSEGVEMLGCVGRVDPSCGWRKGAGKHVRDCDCACGKNKGGGSSGPNSVCLLRCECVPFVCFPLTQTVSFF